MTKETMTRSVTKMKADKPTPDGNEFDSSSNSEEKHSAIKSSTTKNANANSSADTSHHCSQCGKAFLRSETTCMPFCSKRCQQIDLGNWLNESYGLPIEGNENSEFGTVDDDEELTES